MKTWGARLAGRDAALKFRSLCEQQLKDGQLLTINMAGVKDLTAGFAYECFGKLYLTANSRGARIKFSHVDSDLKPIVLSGVRAALR